MGSRGTGYKMTLNYIKLEYVVNINVFAFHNHSPGNKVFIKRFIFLVCFMPAQLKAL